MSIRVSKQASKLQGSQSRPTGRKVFCQEFVPLRWALGRLPLCLVCSLSLPDARQETRELEILDFEILCFIADGRSEGWYDTLVYEEDRARDSFS